MDGNWRSQIGNRWAASNGVQRYFEAKGNVMRTILQIAVVLFIGFIVVDGLMNFTLRRRLPVGKVQTHRSINTTLSCSALPRRTNDRQPPKN